MATKAKIVSIGNSRGVRLPKPLIEQAGLGEEVELHVKGNTIVIAAAKTRRAGWAEAAKEAAINGDDAIDPPTKNRFDDDEWRW